MAPETEFNPLREEKEREFQAKEIEPGKKTEKIVPSSGELATFDIEREQRLAEITERIRKPLEVKSEDTAKALPVKSEIVKVGDQEFTVSYVPKERIAPAFGCAYTVSADVRDDLPPRVTRFVKAHELYHLTDKSKFFGRLGGEFRANFMCGLRDPVGLAATATAAIRSGGLQRFWQRIRNEGLLNQFR